jgi:hypothetical protein
MKFARPSEADSRVEEAEEEDVFVGTYKARVGCVDIPLKLKSDRDDDSGCMSKESGLFFCGVVVPPDSNPSFNTP